MMQESIQEWIEYWCKCGDYRYKIRAKYNDGRAPIGDCDQCQGVFPQDFHPIFRCVVENGIRL